MNDALVVAASCLMVLAPCLVAVFSSGGDSSGDSGPVVDQTNWQPPIIAHGEVPARARRPKQMDSRW